MTHFRGNVRDLSFNLLEALRVQDSPAAQTAGLDEETIRAILTEMDDVATTILADGFVPSDREPVRFDPATHTVSVPDDFASRFHRFWKTEWWRMFLPDELGGSQTPWSVRWAAFESVLASNPGIFFYMQCPPFAEVVYRKGTEEQKRWAQFMVDRAWGATMVLTEADAGSDVGAGRTSASIQPDGTWHISGVKRFITSGEHDLGENIMHLVLARPEGHAAGTKGLSLFLVPKFHFDSASGEIGERNGVFATNIEDKMGMKISATCEMSFGLHGVPAVGWLLGEVHAGIAQMFEVIAYARLLVAVKAVGTLSTGYLTALDFARQRVQGTDITRINDRTAPRVPIIRHPEVRRALMLQKGYAEGLRGLALYTASLKDEAERSGADSTAARQCSFLLPIVKAVSAQRANEQLTEALQILGGSGFLRDYPLEQYIRDSKIDSLYEGTTAIQSIDLFFRQIVRDGGATANTVLDDVEQLARAAAADPDLRTEAGLLRRAHSDVTAMIVRLVDTTARAAAEPTALEVVGQHTVRLLMALGDLLVAWQLLRHAQIALAALTGDCPKSDSAFYRGKVAAARAFSRSVLPRLSADLAVIEAADNTLMSVEADEF